jgi:hypothetical protein
MSQSLEADRSSTAAADEIQATVVESVAAAGSESPFSTMSSTKADQTMAENKIPNPYEY